MKAVVTILAAALIAPAALAHPTKHTGGDVGRFLKKRAVHHQFVCANGRGKPRRWHCAALKWTHREQHELAEAKHKRYLASVPRGESQLRAYINDDCLEEIIDRETAGTWSPTIYNYSGSGAYGLPQALPGSKMRSAGADWRTNPVTQIKWAEEYVRARYGGSCSALAHHNANGWY